MRGFITGSLLLIALEVFLSGNGPKQASGLLGWSTTALDKVLSPDVAAIPQTKTQPTTSAATPTATTTIPGAVTGVSAI